MTKVALGSIGGSAGVGIFVGNDDLGASSAATGGGCSRAG